ncbi:MAG TPA: hypothetical protein GXZ36_02070 [Firmicutes bacterium]|nr:hypothetical protein [Bacillota bacterium]
MKQPTISTWAKRNFIQWLLENYTFTTNNPRKILLSLVEQRDPLSLIHIVKDGAFYRPLLIISSEGSGMPPCYLLTEDEETSNPDRIEQALDVLKQSDLYITFYFPDRLDCQAFLNVLEEPLIELEPEKASTLQFDFELRLLQEENKKAEQRREILARIDQVLASGSRDEFYRLVRELKKI